MALQVDLICHPATQTPVIHRVSATLERGDELQLCFRLSGAVDQLLLPPPTTPRQTDGLWQHTCFEAFLMLEALPGYYELNFSPSGEWAAYSFRSYRTGAAQLDETCAPAITCDRGGDWFELAAIVPLPKLSQLLQSAALRVGLSAVLEARDGGLSYWALAHPVARPDFHHPDTFALYVPVR